MHPYAWFTLLIEWIMHFLFFRRRWSVEVKRLAQGASLGELLTPEIWEYPGYRSKAEARVAMRKMAAQIIAGTWNPQLPS
jgi:hypothetical protein